MPAGNMSESRYQVESVRIWAVTYTNLIRIPKVGEHVYGFSNSRARWLKDGFVEPSDKPYYEKTQKEIKDLIGQIASNNHEIWDLYPVLAKATTKAKNAVNNIVLTDRGHQLILHVLYAIDAGLVKENGRVWIPTIDYVRFQ